MADISALSETDASNTSISGANVAEGCMPSSINDAIRNLAGMLKRDWDRKGPTKTSSGNDTITLTLDTAPASYVRGEVIAFIAGGTNTGTATFNVNSLGAKTIKKGSAGTTNLSAGDITSGGVYFLSYDGTNFQLLNPPSAGSAASPALVLLETNTASGSSALNFTSTISSTYDDYLIEVVGVTPATDNVSLQMQMSTDGGSTYDATSGHYKWGMAGLKIGTGADTQNSASDTSISIMVALGNASTRSVSASIRLCAPGSAALHKILHGTQTSIITDGNLYTYAWGAAFVQTTAVNAFRFLMSSGNIASGSIRTYGIIKS